MHSIWLNILILKMTKLGAREGQGLTPKSPREQKAELVQKSGVLATNQLFHPQSLLWAGCLQTVPALTQAVSLWLPGEGYAFCGLTESRALNNSSI